MSTVRAPGSDSTFHESPKWHRCQSSVYMPRVQGLPKPDAHKAWRWSTAALGEVLALHLGTHARQSKKSHRLRARCEV